MSLYESAPMPHPDKQIRLLKLESHSSELDFAYCLKTHDLNEHCPSYTAISYTWGDEAPLLPLRVNDVTILIRLNCWYALWQLRAKSPSAHVWIDQISIDQKDLTEKGAQVAMMGDIYRRGSFVAACLGPGRVFDRLRTMKGFGEAQTQSCWRTLDEYTYWDRAWVRQELLLARDVVFHCGAMSMHWEELDALWQKYLKRQRHPHEPEYRPKFKSFDRVPHNVVCSASRALRIIHASCRSECSNPRDKIYSILSLLRDHSPFVHIVRPDYKLPLAELFLRTQLALATIYEWHANTGQADCLEILSILIDAWDLNYEMLRPLDLPSISPLQQCDNGSTGVHSRQAYRYTLQSITSIKVSIPWENTKTTSASSPDLTQRRSVRPSRDFAIGNTQPLRDGASWSSTRDLLVRYGAALLPILSIGSFTLVDVGQDYIFQTMKYSLVAATPTKSTVAGKPAVKLLTWTDPYTSQKPGPPGQTFLVHEDVEDGDMVASLFWEPYRRNKVPEYSVVILRQTRNHVARGSHLLGSSYVLHSWAVPTSVHELYADSHGDMRGTQSPPTLQLRPDNSTGQLRRVFPESRNGYRLSLEARFLRIRSRVDFSDSIPDVNEEIHTSGHIDIPLKQISQSLFFQQNPLLALQEVIDIPVEVTWSTDRDEDNKV